LRRHDSSAGNAFVFQDALDKVDLAINEDGRLSNRKLRGIVRG
jgi:hypothetical protein